MPFTFKERALVISKLCLSFARRDWRLSDYPVKIKKQLDTTRGRLKTRDYAAIILHWGLAGTGDTKQDALRDLESKFGAAKSNRALKGQTLPRPGTRVPVQFASTERINAHPELAADFIRRVLEVDWAWVSDDSSLWDFHTGETNDALLAKINEVYGVDVADISSARLYEIFDRIADARVS